MLTEESKALRASPSPGAAAASTKEPFCRSIGVAWKSIGTTENVNTVITPTWKIFGLRQASQATPVDSSRSSPVETKFSLRSERKTRSFVVQGTKGTSVSAKNERVEFEMQIMRYRQIDSRSNS
jgi:hypothetical protein